MTTRSVSSVPSFPSSMMCSNVILTPGEWDSSTQMRGGSTRVIVKVLRGKPFALLVMMPPGWNSPSSRAESMCSDSLQLATSTHADHTLSGAARDTPEASYEDTPGQAISAVIGGHDRQAIDAIGESPLDALPDEGAYRNASGPERVTVCVMWTPESHGSIRCSNSRRPPGNFASDAKNASGSTATRRNRRAGEPGGLDCPLVPTSKGPSIRDHSTPRCDQSHQLDTSR